MHTKTTHTGRGTCQVCGGVQAIDNATLITAKHGYKVAGYGFFNGVCPGAWHVPAEKSLDVTHAIIAQLEEAAATHDAEAKGYGDFVVAGGSIVFGVDSIRCSTYEVYDRELVVTKRSSRGHTYQTTGGYKAVAIDDSTPVQTVIDTQRKAVAIAEQNARHARGHVNMMRQFIVPRLGCAFHPPKEVVRAERIAAKAKALEGVRFPTQASRKDALDKLNRMYDRAREALQLFYLALPDSERTEAKTEIYYSAQGLHQWRAKHAEAALREFPAAREIVERINALVVQREEIKNAK